ncbi:MAG: hypothetical protein N3A65_01625 [candidate division WOR-3 bacterium]|nr:hypothetical protein [candidate division WOR-3 bacterium]
MKEEKSRNSFGLSLGVNIVHNFGWITGGVKFWTHFVSFDAKCPDQWGMVIPPMNQNIFL